MCAWTSRRNVSEGVAAGKPDARVLTDAANGGTLWSTVSDQPLRPTRRLPALALVGALGACAPATPAGAPPAEPAPASASAAATPATAPVADPYHPPPRDTVDVSLYKAWQQYSLQCARCHGEDGQGTSFGPSLLHALNPDGDVPTKAEFLATW